MCKITIFTATYNRGHLLVNLYNSLKNLSNHDFEWLIIDDGSTDDTQDVVTVMQNEIFGFNIRYYKQVNGGKHRAINKGLLLANGKLFFIVDSDDILPKNSIDIILNKYELIKDKENIAGIAGRKAYFDGSFIGSDIVYNDFVESSLNFRSRLKIKGDMAEVFRTEIIKEYLFPEFENEKFCPEALVYNRIALKYDILWFSDKIYLAEYLEDGLTSKIFEVRKKSPEATLLYYSELSGMNIPLLNKIKAVSNYWRFSIYSRRTFLDKLKKVSLFFSLMSFPLSILLIAKDKWL